ncbi:Uncharacterised protein [Mycobacteroides abscessus subsp. abscessus]|nr:Uncharacterised protein [Mycobacteroides abscessus subsp. abscessus]
MRQRRHRVDLRQFGDAEGLAQPGDLGAEQAQHGMVGGLGGLGVGPEDHLRQEVQQGGPAVGFGVDPDGAVEVAEHEMVLDAAVQVEVEVLRRLPVAEVRDVLTGDGVQPAQPFAAGDAQHEPVGTIHDRDPLDRGALLTERVAVVPGHRGVRRTGRTRDSARDGEEGAGCIEHGHTSTLGGPRRTCVRRPRGASEFPPPGRLGDSRVGAPNPAKRTLR